MQRYLKPALGILWTLSFLLAACETPLDTDRPDTDKTDADDTDTEGIAPAAPESLLLSIQNGEVVLSWTDSSTTAEGFRLYRSALEDDPEMIAELEANTTSHTDFSAGDDVTYTYRVVAYNQFGESDPVEDTIYVPQRYTVTYYPGTGCTGGEVPTGPTRYLAGGSAWIHDNIGKLRGAEIRDEIYQRFRTWNTQEDGEGDDRLNQYFSNIQADVTMYAQYTTDDEVLGKIGPAGGLVFHERDTQEPEEWRYLEAAPVSTEWFQIQWGPDASIEAAEREIGTGADNTELIVTWLNDGPYYYEANYAAKLARGLDHGGYEWFLPSIDELKAMYTVLHKVDPPLGSFGNTVYWSSTKGANTPIAMNFDTGSEQQDTPINSKRVRAARSF